MKIKGLGDFDAILGRYGSLTKEAIGHLSQPGGLPTPTLTWATMTWLRGRNLDGAPPNNPSGSPANPQIVPRWDAFNKTGALLASSGHRTCMTKTRRCGCYAGKAVFIIFRLFGPAADLLDQDGLQCNALANHQVHCARARISLPPPLGNHALSRLGIGRLRDPEDWTVRNRSVASLGVRSRPGPPSRSWRPTP